ncbi:tRNA (adenosine(37)-N6)-threonylcarbamoyltransferase complex transferase subunit TsaD [Candidatus Woesearchaeota archaeon]|nr:tRNA (adenosine(37)-N6)-threonylcarbamoyltransferase complex transferase subunit TsaD [Nanoarchaeota archaeon]MCB9370380.1 tRNA (adenosine(37)-N6)-threonylcarbamoyltransferase complex transferase subunit TsaD [Candidatus Woesearchaeota archaeon]USN44900.1 MAG: tRNA (adenosine(37)-N6)-threonylcarbamoyltransferase complex transferase subunit TsaD [Candidatus Woesearchaeota archaeon]
MLILGIESTAHTFAMGLLETSKKQVLFHEKVQFQNDVGMDPRKLGDFHTREFSSVLLKLTEFLKKEHLTFADIHLLSFSQGPGIGNALKIGCTVAKTLSLRFNIPLVGVNHIKAHLEIGKFFTSFKDPLFLYVSGVNTQVIAKDDFGNYKIYGETEDIGLGNLLDSFARLVGLGFPGGPLIEQEAKKSHTYIELPYTVKGMNISLAGLHSHLKQCTEKGMSREDLCYSVQETVFAMVMEVVERAMAYTKKEEFLIVGGVAANQRLREMAEAMCKIRKAKFKTFPFQYCLDNAIMIAWQGYLDKDKATSKDFGKLKPLPYETVESFLL